VRPSPAPAVHPRICVSGVSSWGWSLDEELALCRELGIANIGASLRKFGPDDADAVARIEDSGVRVANLINVGGFVIAEPAGWPAARDHLKRVVDLAVRLGRPCLVMTTGRAGPITWEEAADRFAEAGAPVFAHARDAGVEFAIEHTSPLRVDVAFVHSLRDILDLARRVDTGVTMDLNPCWAERGLADTITRGIDRIRVVQVSDYVIGTQNTPNRAVVGDGDIPIERILRQVLDAGYGGVFDLELLGPAIEAEGYASAIRRSCEHLGTVLDRLGA
jgi:sugar phosphate isomerase/epimerase